MPIYTYKCTKCNKEKTLRVGFSDYPPNKCSDLEQDNKCDGEVKKIFNQPSGFSLKGSGWFKDGY